jgi:hypothetical protein
VSKLHRVRLSHTPAPSSNEMQENFQA